MLIVIHTDQNAIYNLHLKKPWGSYEPLTTASVPGYTLWKLFESAVLDI